MKKATRTISTLLIAVILIQIATPSVYAADSPNPATTPPPSNLASDADAACAEYRAFATSREGGTGQKMSLKYVQQACGLPTGVMSEKEGSAQLINQGIDDTYKSNDPDWDSCFQSLKHRWMILAEKCEARDLVEKGKTDMFYPATAYSVAAGVCCLAAIPALSGAMASYCSWSSISATGIDAISQIALYQFTQSVSSRMGGLMDTANLGGAAVSFVNSLYQIAALKGKQTAGPQVACAVNLGLAGIRWLSYNNLAQYQDEANKESVNQFLSNSVVIKPGNNSSNSNSSSGGYSNGSGGSANSGSLGSDKKAAPNGGYASSLSDNMSLASPQFAAASTGFGGEVFNRLQNKDKLAQLLKQKTGVGLTDIARKLESGQSPATILSSIPGLEKLSGSFKAIEADAIQFAQKQGLATAGSGAYAARGGAGSSGSKAGDMDFGSMFGAKDAGMGAGGSSAIAFEKMKQALAVGSSSEDIYHETYKGSIFDIATQRLDKSRKNVDELEWESPMNRALLGLPKRLTTRAGASKTTLVK